MNIVVIPSGPKTWTKFMFLSGTFYFSSTTMSSYPKLPIHHQTPKVSCVPKSIVLPITNGRALNTGP